jgi:hypothetical protein
MSDTDSLELACYRDALTLAYNVQAWSRTAKAGRLRLLAVQHVICGEPDVDTIAMRMGVSRRRVFQTLNEVRCHCNGAVS